MLGDVSYVDGSCLFLSYFSYLFVLIHRVTCITRRIATRFIGSTSSTPSTILSVRVACARSLSKPTTTWAENTSPWLSMLVWLSAVLWVDVDPVGIYRGRQTVSIKISRVPAACNFAVLGRKLRREDGTRLYRKWWTICSRANISTPSTGCRFTAGQWTSGTTWRRGSSTTRSTRTTSDGSCRFHASSEYHTAWCSQTSSQLTTRTHADKARFHSNAIACVAFVA